MKKLLSILLLCFCFYATAQNSSTIQQLLDEGITVGELLDAGISVDELYGKEYQGGNVYMPEFSFNGIGDLTPGHGYQIKVTDYILDFNICE